MFEMRCSREPRFALLRAVRNWPDPIPMLGLQRNSRARHQLLPKLRQGTLGSPFRRDAVGLVAAMVLIILWDASGLDRRVSQLFGTDKGFSWRDHWLTASVLHDKVKFVAWPLVLVLAISIWFPISSLKKLTRSQRAWLLLTTIGCATLISWLRRYNLTSCPWDLKEFGGSVPTYVSHWSRATDRGPGQCFPSGHASMAFSFLPGWLALRTVSPRISRAWLLVMLALGTALGWVQVMRGAHFVSHWLWTGWICAAFAIALYHLSPCWRRRSGACIPEVGGLASPG